MTPKRLRDISVLSGGGVLENGDGDGVVNAVNCFEIEGSREADEMDEKGGEDEVDEDDEIDEDEEDDEAEEELEDEEEDVEGFEEEVGGGRGERVEERAEEEAGKWFFFQLQLSLIYSFALQRTFILTVSSLDGKE